MSFQNLPDPRPDWDLACLSEAAPSPSLGMAGPEEPTPAPESTRAETSFGNYRSPIFWSALLHLAIFLLLLGWLYGMDARPVRKVNHWVVNLATLLKEEPQGPQAAVREDLSLLTRPFRPAPEPPARRVQESQTPTPRDVIPLEESPRALAEAASKEISGENPLSSSPPGEKAEENALHALKESAAPQAGMGQYLFQMKMGDPMVAVKMRYLQRNLREQMLGVFRTRMGEEKAHLISGAFASVEISYDEKGLVKSVIFTPDSPETLTDLMKDVDWNSLASPKGFGLSFRTARIRLGVDSGDQITVNVSFL
jgi:hypothetical protein